MRFAHPAALWLLVLLPGAVFVFVTAYLKRRQRVSQLGRGEVLAKMMPHVSKNRFVVHAALFILSMTLLVLALARPQMGGRATLQKQPGLDLVVALDFSRSMRARDIYPSRLERAKRELESLLDRLSGDRVGVVAFAGETMTYPPTTDYAAVKLFWRDLGPDDMPVGGTALGRALRTGLEQLKRLRQRRDDDRSQVILLLTDGEDTESEPLEVAEEAAELGVKIFAVGIGSRSGELIPTYDDEGNETGYVRDREGHYVTSRLGEGLLMQIAQKTGGAYFRAEERSFGVDRVEAALAQLKRTENEGRLIKQYDEIFVAVALPAFLLLILDGALARRRRVRKVESRTKHPEHTMGVVS
jgi:Ca-activated chloride channel family protein